MREIEWQNGMRKTIYFEILRQSNLRDQLDDWKRLPPNEQTLLATSYQPLPGPNASFMLYATAAIAIVGWPGVTIAKIIELAVD
jgi:hypothetical protein